MPEIPKMPGLTPMTPLEMNAVHFGKKHTVLTENLLKAIARSQKSSVDR